MLKLFWSPAPDADASPLTHPALSRMDLALLADLPPEALRDRPPTAAAPAGRRASEPASRLARLLAALRRLSPPDPPRCAPGAR